MNFTKIVLRPLSFLMLTAVGLSGCASSGPKQPVKRAEESRHVLQNTKEIHNALDAEIERAMQTWKVPGLAIAIVKDDAVVFTKGYGVREVGKDDSVDEHTVFAIGSITKAITATALGLLVQEGKLSWDDRVTKHLLDFQLYDPYVTRELTVRDLLSHRTGLPSDTLLYFRAGYDRDEILRRIRYLEPRSSFRSQFEYQNIMFLAAGQIIPSIAGISWDDFVKRRIFQPLGMNRTNTSISDLVNLPNVASSHTWIDDEIVAIPYGDLDNVAPAGSVNSSVMDMSQWLRLQLGNGEYNGTQFIDSSVIRETRTPQTLIRINPVMRKFFPSTHFFAYGLGWALKDYNGRLLVYHGGHAEGNGSIVGIVPEENLGVVILTNYNRHRLESALFYRVVDAYLNQPPRDWSSLFLEQRRQAEERAAVKKTKIEASRVHGTSPTLSLGAYVGTYEHDAYGEVEIAHEGGKLVLRYGCALVGDLEHWHYDTFVANWRDKWLGKLFVTYLLDAEDKVAELKLEGLGSFRRSPE